MNLKTTDKLKFGVPNKGRLKEPVLDLLKRAGFDFRVRERALFATAGADVVFIFLRPDDIPVLLQQGVLDLGITGQDLIEEKQADKVCEILSLGMGKCRLSLAVPEAMQNVKPSDFAAKVVATSFPYITQKWFAAQGVKVGVVEMNGSVEAMIALGLADAIVDLVETGDSLRDNALAVAADLMKSETCLFARPGLEKDPRVLSIRRRIEGLLIAAQYSLLEYNIPRAKLQEAEVITPGFSSPTVTNLEDKDWVSIKVMVKKKEVVTVMEKLEHIGAAAVLETEIKNCRL